MRYWSGFTECFLLTAANTLYLGGPQSGPRMSDNAASALLQYSGRISGLAVDTTPKRVSSMYMI
jgi:hypothetical protein